MASWDTRAGTLTNIRDKYDDAKDAQQAMAGHMTSMSGYASTEEWALAFGQCWYALNEVRNALSKLYYVKSASPLEFALTYFLETYTIETAGEFDLTWEKIIAAWDAANLQGWGRTVLAIDQMRQEIFNQPMTKFGPLPIFQ